LLNCCASGSSTGYVGPMQRPFAADPQRRHRLPSNDIPAA
jgi:hypothetical protein